MAGPHPSLHVCVCVLTMGILWQIWAAPYTHPVVAQTTLQSLWAVSAQPTPVLSPSFVCCSPCFSTQPLCHGLFVFLMLSYRSCLYMLDINRLSVISFANIFSHLVGCLFVSLMVSFAVQKLLSLIRSHLFVFAFISFVLGDRFKKMLLQFYVKECSACIFL